MVAMALHDIPLLGSMPHHDVTLPERHLGLVLPSEVKDLEHRLATLADLLVLNDSAWNDIPEVAQWAVAEPVAEAPAPWLNRKLVAIARDEAFAFFYPANIRCLEALG